MGSTSVSGTGFAARTAASAASIALLGGAALLLGGATRAEGGTLPRPEGASLDVQIVKLRSAKGMLRLCLTTEPKSFPDCKKGHVITRSVSAATPHIRFEGLPPGTYGLAVIHDENGNSKLDTFVGMPREGFGFSRNPAIGFGPPRFGSTSFTVSASGTEPQQVKMRYLL